MTFHKTLQGGWGRNTTHSHLQTDKLKRLREACRGLGVNITDTQFTGVIILSMPMPSWDPIVGTLGGVLDPRVIISHLNTEWSQRQGLTSISKNSNIVFQTNAHPKCENCNWTGHIKAKCWSKGGGQEGQYPKGFRGRNHTQASNAINSVRDTPIVWAYGSANRP